MDLRSQTLLEDLGAFPPADERERASLERMMRFVNGAAKPFDRGNAEGHITGSAVVARSDGSAFLLVHHRKLDRWLQPGGHCDPMDGGVLGTALREAQEETASAISSRRSTGVRSTWTCTRFPRRTASPRTCTTTCGTS